MIELPDGGHCVKFLYHHMDKAVEGLHLGRVRAFWLHHAAAIQIQSTKRN